MNWRPQSTPKTGSSYTPMFVAPTTRFLPSAKNAVSGALLPLHDLTAVNLPGFNPDDPGWRRSVGPWRGNQPDSSGHLELNFMPAYVLVHAGVGPNNDDVLSPQSRLNLWIRPGAPSETEDPAVQILNYAKGSDRWKHLTDDKSDKTGKRAAIRFPSTKALFNAVGVDAKTTDGQTRMGVLVLPKASWPDFTRLMNIGRMQINVPTPRDPRWPDYLYGDVTDPDNPLKFRTMEKHSSTNAGQKFQAFVFSNNEASLNGAEGAPRFTAEMLEKRLFLHDAGIYNIPTYDALLTRIIAEGWYPVELVREALGEKANIGGTQALGGVAPQAAYQPPPQPAQPAYQPPPPAQPAYQPPQPAQPAYQPPQPAQPAYQPPPPPSQPAYQPPPPPQVAEPEFWVHANGAVETGLSKASSVSARVALGESLMLCRKDTSEWKTAAELGFVRDDIPGIPPSPPVGAPPAYTPPVYTQPSRPPVDDNPLGTARPPAPAANQAFAGMSNEALQGRMDSLSNQLAGGDVSVAAELTAVSSELRSRGVIA